MPPSGEPNGPALPGDDVLFAELKLARQHGLDNRSRPLTELDGLLLVARVISSEVEDTDKIKDAITKATRRLGGKPAESILVLMGLIDDTRGQSVEDRRTEAAKRYGHVAYDTYRKDIEPGLLRSVATHLTSLVNEHRMARHARFKTEQQSKPPISDVVEDISPPPLTADDRSQPQLPEQSEPDALLGRRRWLAVAAVVALASVALAADRLLPGASQATPRGCGPTTARLVQLPYPPPNSETPDALYLNAPHQDAAEHGWASYSLGWSVGRQEIFHFGEVRIFAIAYFNKYAQPVTNVIARAGLPQGAALQPNSTCVYRGNNTSGTRYGGQALIQSAGLPLGTLVPNAKTLVTFAERLPKALNGESAVTTYGAIDRASQLPEPNWYEHAPWLSVRLTR